MKEKITIDEKILKSVGPYSIAIKSNNLIFLSGMIGLKPGTTELVSDNVLEQTRQILENLLSILKGLKLTTDNIVKTTIYTVELEKFAQINEIYKEYFNEPYPARVVVGVSKLPLNAKIEIEFIISI